MEQENSEGCLNLGISDYQCNCLIGYAGLYFAIGLFGEMEEVGFRKKMERLNHLLAYLLFS